MRHFIILLSLLVSASVSAGTFSVKDFGAAGDGKTIETAAVQAAVDRAAECGGGTVVVPQGVYVCGSIWLRSNIRLKLESGAVIKGSPDINDYCSADCCSQNSGEPKSGDYVSGGHLLLGVNVHNVTLCGPGRIDGNSDAFLLDRDGKRYAKKSLIPCRPAQMVWFVDSQDIRIENVELADAPYWSCFIHNCERIWIDGCYVHTRRKDYHTFNGDGIDIDRSRYVTISNCRIDTADDCITLRASDAELLANPQDCAYVSVTNCNISTSCNAIRIGVGEGSIHDAVFSNLTISDTKLAFNIVGSYSAKRRGTDISNIRFQNITVDAKELVRIHHMYSGEAVFKDIYFDGISGSAPSDSKIWARKTCPFQNIVFRNVDIPACFECVNAEVKIESGCFVKKKLSPKELALRNYNIDNQKKLLY